MTNEEQKCVVGVADLRASYVPDVWPFVVAEILKRAIPLRYYLD